MKNLNLATLVTLSIFAGGCSMFKQEAPVQGNTRTAQSTEVQNVDVNKQSHDKAASMTSGWPDPSVNAAKEMFVRYGDPSEVTQDELIWKTVLPFKRIIVHREIYSDRFPLLHQTALEHVVNYNVPDNKVDDIWKYDGSVVLNRTKGEMSASGQSEEMNILALNLAHSIITGKISAEQARIQFGKETMNFLNGNRTAATQTLAFGNQINTTDTGETITNKIRWQGDSARKPAKQAQQAK